jgi:hypothetical protein
MRIAPLLVLLAAACASPTDVIDKRSFQCGPGRDIEIRAAIVDPAASREATGPVVYMVEVANNSHQDVTVTYIRLEPRGDNPERLRGESRTVNQLIPSGKDHVFEIPATDVLVRAPGSVQRLEERRLPFSARVSLANGDSYHCEFETLWK